MDHFELVSQYAPTGDQPQAIEELVKGFQEGNQFQTLLGVTGSGKTFTMANVIQQLNKPTLIIAHNKTLAAQLYGEFKEFFPNNAVEYFVSYYDYYQPEAYVPSSDTYIAKDSAINDEIDKLRLSATMALAERKDVIIVSSVSCIYGLGDPVDYKEMVISLRPGMEKDRDEVMRKLIDIQYDRNDMDFKRGTFRVRGDVLEIFPAMNTDTAIRVEFFGDEIDRITEIDVLTGEVKTSLEHAAVFPASHYVVPMEKILEAAKNIETELEERVRWFKSEDKLLEAQRISERTNFDIEMMKETGFCSGIENYSRHLAGLEPGATPHTLIDYFPDDFLIIIDESHKTVPQIRGMFAGDQSRKTTLVDYGFRLPSAKDNRPLNFGEFESKIDQMLFVSATPGDYEADHELLRSEQIIRPTGLLDPAVEVRPVEGQIDDLVGEVNKEVTKGNKILITTLTKRMAEDLTDYMREIGIRVKYLHSDIDTLERTEIIRDMRLNLFDVLVGINLLREGLDIPEITLVAILDADKEGFLRSETSLVQTIGRAARNAEGHVIMYADTITDSMRLAIEETQRRRSIQEAYNEAHGITPQTIKKAVRGLISISKEVEKKNDDFEIDPESMTKKELEKLAADIQKKMKQAAAELNFEEAALLRDKMILLKKQLQELEH
ncbi:excinuclease ABC subunit UvrB [Hominisplanchenecus murintestinalis]|uniref:Excinuclease ABC subunit UvrB n=1 Tax=Hominisplanchenecus murintestinalis TaxID=2941517 RepID=A0AC61R1F3_9FIRM|nr:excinuclease ABC subunit UvrB [Hominisplanchenecus murintestinalis]TGY00109.1 excinuclease ABC subunit UvrB [Hominisplanchenecus murintestinalis]